jgi:hypothetical protein
VIGCDPADSAAVEKLARPPLSGSLTRVVVPSSKVTVPVGVPELEEVTTAVKITDWPTADGFAELLRETDVAPETALTVCESAPEVLHAKLLSPP